MNDLDVSISEYGVIADILEIYAADNKGRSVGMDCQILSERIRDWINQQTSPEN